MGNHFLNVINYFSACGNITDCPTKSVSMFPIFEKCFHQWENYCYNKQHGSLLVGRSIFASIKLVSCNSNTLLLSLMFQLVGKYVSNGKKEDFIGADMCSLVGRSLKQSLNVINYVSFSRIITAFITEISNASTSEKNFPLVLKLDF